MLCNVINSTSLNILVCLHSVFLVSSFSAVAFLLAFVVLLFTLKILFTLQPNLLIYKGLTVLGSTNATNCNMINMTDGPDFVIGSPKEPLFMKLKKKYHLCSVAS